MLLPTPVDGNDPTIATLKSDIRALRGKLALVESTSSGWAADGTAQRPKGDWEPRRLGASPGSPLIDQADLASREVYAACGIPLSIVTDELKGQASAKGSADFIHSTITADGKDRFTRTVRQIRDPDLALSFDGIFAADLGGQGSGLPKPCRRRHGRGQGRFVGGLDASR